MKLEIKEDSIVFTVTGENESHEIELTERMLVESLAAIYAKKEAGKGIDSLIKDARHISTKLK